MKTQKSTKNLSRKKFNWLASHKKLVIITGILLAVVAVPAVYAYTRTSVPEQSSSKPSYGQSAKMTTIHIESNISGISIEGSPYCDSLKQHAHTPYDCQLPSGKTETVLTAPAQAFADGKAYAFDSWDGCAESNADHKVCKVKVSDGDIKKTVVTYKQNAATSTSGNNATADNAPIGCPSKPSTS